jgi:hypothetical protein
MDERKKRMNERIQELARKTVEAVQHKPNGICDMNKYNQKFAELIVQECAEVAINNGCGDFVDIKQKLFEHFELQNTITQERHPPLDSSYPDGNGYWK